MSVPVAGNISNPSYEAFELCQPENGPDDPFVRGSVKFPWTAVLHTICGPKILIVQVERVAVPVSPCRNLDDHCDAFVSLTPVTVAAA